MSLKTKICKEIDDKVDKDFIANALQEGIADPEGPTQQTINGSIQGFIPALAGNLVTQSQFGYGGAFGYDTDLYPVVPTIEAPISKACGTGSNDTSVIGTLVINPNLPAGSSDVFDLQITPLDISAGMGGVILFCPATGEYTAPQGTYSGTVGQVRTISGLDASSLSCPIEDVRVGFLAFGANGNSIYEGNCDEISNEVGAIVAITPSECIGAAECAEALFGCSLGDMLLSDPENPVTALANKVDEFQTTIYRLSEPANGYKIKAWFDNDDKAVAHPAGLNTPALVDAFIDSVFDVSSGQPVHVNGDPSLEIIYDTSSNFNDGNSSFPDGQGSGLDQYVIETYVDTTGMGPVDLQELNGNSGEAGRIYVSQCCGPLSVAGHILDTPPYYAGQFASALPEGVHCVLTLLSDRTAFGGFNLRWRPTGTEEFTNIPVANLWTEKREVECRQVAACDVIDLLPEGWSRTEPKLCSPKPAIEAPAKVPTGCPVVVGELENVDGPINLNPDAATPITWGGWQSQDDSVVEVGNAEVTVLGTDVCAAHVTMSVTFINVDGEATGDAQRAHPEVWILRDGQRWALAQIYIRDANGQDSDTASVDKWDLDPVGRVYSLQVQQDSIETPASGQADTGTLEVFREPEIASYLQVAAFNKL